MCSMLPLEFWSSYFSEYLPLIAITKSSHWRCSIKKVVLKNFAIFTGKHLCWSTFLIKLQACNFIKKRLQHSYFENIYFEKLLRMVAFVYLSCFIYYHFPNLYKIYIYNIQLSLLRAYFAWYLLTIKVIEMCGYVKYNSIYTCREYWK